jgi:hypothetical protein
MAWHSYHHARIEEKQSQKKNSQAQDSIFCSREKPCQATCLGYKEHFLSSAIRKERLSGDESSLTSESDLEMCHDDLPMRQRPVKSPVLRLGLSSSSELEESSLEKSRSLRAAHARDIIF